MFHIVYQEPDEFAELRRAAELVEYFLERANPRVFGEEVIEAAKAELTLIYGEITPYDYIPF